MKRQGTSNFLRAKRAVCKRVCVCVALMVRKHTELMTKDLNDVHEIAAEKHILELN